MKNSFLLLIPVVLVTGSLFTACKKQSETGVGEQTSEFAALKAWFKSEIVDNEADRINSTPTNTPDDDRFRRYARIGKIEKRIEWESASKFNQNGFNFIIVHIDDGNEIINKNFSASRYLIFYENHLGKQMKVLEILNHSKSKPPNETDLAKKSLS